MPTNHTTSPSRTVTMSPSFDSPHVWHTATTAPPLIEGCGRMTSGMSPTANDLLSVPPSNAMSPTANDNHPCHVTWQKCPPWTPHYKDQGSEEGRKRSKRGKERERGNCRWGGGHLCPLPPAPSFQRTVRWCATHTLSHLPFQMWMRQCASHTLPCLAFQTQMSSVHPTHCSVQAFLSPSSFGGDFFQQWEKRGGVKSTRRLIQAGLFPPTTGDSLSTTMGQHENIMPSQFHFI